MSVRDVFKFIKWVQIFLRWLSTWKFKQVFGRDAGEKYHIIYNISNVTNRGIVFLRPEPKVKRARYRDTTNLTTINSCATTRAIGHLVYAFGEKVNIPPIISSDVDTDEKMDISFISIGGVTNLKTCDLLEDISNNFLDFEVNSIIHRSSKLPIIKTAPNVDYGFIIKIHPRSNPERTWICCVGLAEWGTSGAAWFLASKWRDIRKWAKDKPFAIITKTVINSDESTKRVYRFLTSEEIEDVARKASATTTVTTITTKTSTSTAAPPTP